MSLSQKIECGESERKITPHTHLQVFTYPEKGSFIQAERTHESWGSTAGFVWQDAAAKPEPRGGGGQAEHRPCFPLAGTPAGLDPGAPPQCSWCLPSSRPGVPVRRLLLSQTRMRWQKQGQSAGRTDSRGPEDSVSSRCKHITGTGWERPSLGASRCFPPLSWKKLGGFGSNFWAPAVCTRKNKHGSKRVYYG